MDQRNLARERQSRACPDVTLEVRTDLASIAGDWRGFEAEAELTPFQSLEWLAKWQHYIGAPAGTRPAIVLGCDQEERLLFILPFAVEPTRFGRRLTWLATDLCDYNGPILAPGVCERLAPFKPLWKEIVALIGSDPELRFDRVELTKMPAEIGSEPNPFMALAPVPEANSAYVANLGDSWEDFFNTKRSAATRKRERRQFKRLAEFGEVSLAEPVTSEGVELTLQRLYAQKAAAFARMGVGNFLMLPGHREFLTAFATDPVNADVVHVTRLDVGETWAATGFGRRFRGTYYLTLSSYEDGPMARYGPGRAHIQALMRWAIENGLERFDFTIGDEPYKRDWSDVTVPLYSHTAATRLSGLPIVLSRAALNGAKRAAKQNPAVYRFLNTVRTRLRRRSGS